MKNLTNNLCLYCCCILFAACIQEAPTNEFYTLNIEFAKKIRPFKYSPIELHEIRDNHIKKYDGKIKQRGGSSLFYYKQSYEIDLEEDETLCGLDADDDWIVNANYIDKTFMRHVIAYELFQNMHVNNLASNTQYVQLKLNNRYNGLYVLMEKPDKSSLCIDRSDTTAVIFKEPHIFRKSYDPVVPQKVGNFHQQTYPKITVDDKTDFIEEVRDFILHSTDKQFTEKFNRIFDLQSILDWHLILLVTNNSDGLLKNFYLYKIDTDTPLRISIWDYDHSFGRDGDNELNLDKRHLKIERSILFARLLEFDWYEEKLKNRWKVLNDEQILSAPALKKRIELKKKHILILAEKNFQKWAVGCRWYFDDNNFEKEVEIMLQFIDLRHDRLSHYFNNL